jgi:hypothetical protein
MTRADDVNGRAFRKRANAQATLEAASLNEIGGPVSRDNGALPSALVP